MREFAVQPIGDISRLDFSSLFCRIADGCCNRSSPRRASAGIRSGVKSDAPRSSRAAHAPECLRGRGQAPGLARLNNGLTISLSSLMSIDAPRWERYIGNETARRVLQTNTDIASLDTDAISVPNQFVRHQRKQ